MWCVFACQYAGNAAAPSPARGGGRLATSSPRSAIARLPSGASPSPCIPPLRAGSAKGGGIPRPAHSVSAEPRCGRRVGAPPAPADSCGAPRPHAARSAVARLGRNTSLRRIGGISLASVRVSRRHRLRLVPPPLQPAPLFHVTGREVCRIGPLRTDPMKGPSYNGLAGSVPTVCAPLAKWHRKRMDAKTTLREIRAFPVQLENSPRN